MGKILLLTLCNVCPGFIRMAATMYYVTWVMQQSTQFATLFISLGVVGMMIGGMLAKVLTDRWLQTESLLLDQYHHGGFLCRVLLLRSKATMMIMVALRPAQHPAPNSFSAALVADGGCR